MARAHHCEVLHVMHRDDTARDTLVFEFSGVVVRCWRCQEQIELLVEEDPTADQICDGCAEWYGISSVAI